MALPTSFDPPEFRDSDFDDRHRQFWRCPIRLAHDGTLAKMWRPSGTIRGGGAAATVLPLLALATQQPKPGQEWTDEQFCQTQDRLAVLGGCSEETIAEGMALLADLGLLRYTTNERGRRGRPVTRYKLHRRLWPQGAEEYVAFPATIVYGGFWALMPYASMRQLYLTIACLDAVRDEEAYIASMLGNGKAEMSGDLVSLLLDTLRARGPAGLDPYILDIQLRDELYPESDQEWRDWYERALAGRRQGDPLAWTTLMRVSGIRNKGTLSRALEMLTHPIHPGAGWDGTWRRWVFALVDSGYCSDQRSQWYAPNRRFHFRAWDMPPQPADGQQSPARRWYAETLNKPRGVDQIRAVCWHHCSAYNRSVAA